MNNMNNMAEEGRSPTWALSGSPPPSPERGWNAPGSLDGHFHFPPVASTTYLWVTGQHIWFSTQFGFYFFQLFIFPVSVKIWLLVLSPKGPRQII